MGTFLLSPGYVIRTADFKPSQNSSILNVAITGWKTSPGVDAQTYQFSYDKNTKEARFTPFSDSLNCDKIIAINGDNYIGYNSKTKYLIKFNSANKILNRIYFNTNSAYELYALKNGSFIFTFQTSNFRIACFDENLGTLWNKPVVSIQQYSPNHNSICSDLNKIYVLEQTSNGVWGYFVNIFDLNGKFDKRIGSNNSASYYQPYIIESENGFVVFSTYIANLIVNWLSVCSYDNTGNLLKESLINPYPTFTSTIISPIIAGDHSYYFTAAYSKSATSFRVESRLVKINSKLEIDWVKPLDAMRNGSEELLVYDGKNIFNMGQSFWGGANGFSFFKTDLEGNF
jgi:hypothetical protein